MALTKKPIKKAVSVAPVKKSTAPAKKAAAPKKAAAAKAPAKKTTTTKKAAAPVAATGREFDEHGFVVGSDSSIIAAALLEGGFDRNEVNANIAKALSGPTRYGNDKNISSLVSGLLSRLKKAGYKVESEWRVVAPTDEERKAAARKAARDAKKAAAVAESTPTKAKASQAPRKAAKAPAKAVAKKAKAA